MQWPDIWLDHDLSAFPLAHFLTTQKVGRRSHRGLHCRKLKRSANGRRTTRLLRSDSQI